MTPPKVRFLRPNKVFGGPKRFQGPPKHKKLIFSKNPNSVICPNIGGCFHIGPGDPGTIKPHYTIHLTKNRLLPTVGGKIYHQLYIYRVKLSILNTLKLRKHIEKLSIYFIFIYFQEMSIHIQRFLQVIYTYTHLPIFKNCQALVLFLVMFQFIEKDQNFFFQNCVLKNTQEVLNVEKEFCELQ